MRPTLIRRTATAAAVVSLALLATACGGGEAQDADAATDNGGEKKGASTAPAAKALTATELKKALLAQGDLANHTIVDPGAGDVLDAEDISVENTECEPIANLTSNAPSGEPAAEGHRMVSSDAKRPSVEELAEMTPEEQLASGMDSMITALSLYSYEDEAAGEAFAAIRTAAEKCAGGFAFTAADEDVTISKVTEVKKESVSGGDEAAAWEVTLKEGGEEIPYKLVAVRQGSTLATFASVDIRASVTGKDFGLPTALVKAQLDKLG
ncbi:hypothetical protein [Streptomyces acidicola]|uniref:hypothetical protein n=1 Tax=Streptomyces acidicola TaxID=2596892 RepID=UPI0038138B75